MNITKKVLKGFSVATLLAMSVGCASVDGIARNQLKTQSQMTSDGTPIVYGQMGSATDADKLQICNAINNADPKCSDNKFSLIVLMTAFGYADGAYSALTWVPKDLEYYQCSRFGNDSCTFAKAKLVDGRYADFIEIASQNRDGKCTWKGLPRVGGVVCPAYNWDYRKNLNDWSTTNGITTVKKK